MIIARHQLRAMSIRICACEYRREEGNQTRLQKYVFEKKFKKWRTVNLKVGEGIWRREEEVEG